MGLSLILIGFTLLFSMWNGISAFDTLIRWWPVVFILLGAEILLFLAFKPKDQSIIHYDIFSIIFVGFLCCLCLMFALGTASGLIHEVRYALGSEYRTYDVEEIKESIPAGVERIIVQTSGAIPKIDTISSRELQLFGSYRIRHYEDNELLQAADLANIRTIDHTMYISIKPLPERSGLNNESSPSATLTLAIPQDMPYELRGANQQPIPPR
ncbi:MAG: hypothetical protein K0R67_2514 [Paenibacillus sp.]|jgi:hypothetical protein|nr:hypothetical protein [Paenibacillus sp.]